MAFNKYERVLLIVILGAIEFVLVVGGEGDLLRGEVYVADGALEACRMINVSFASDDLAFNLFVTLLAVHLVAVLLLRKYSETRL